MDEEIPTLTEMLELFAADAVNKIRTRMNEGFEKAGSTSSGYSKKSADFYADADRWLEILKVCISGLRPSGGPTDATEIAFEAIKRLHMEAQDPSGG